MTIDNVDQLIQSIFEIPEDAVKSASDWLEITRLLAEFIAKADDLLVIQTYSDRYETCHPYLQICYEDDRAMTIEAVSNKFLRPKLSIDAQNTMLELVGNFQTMPISLTTSSSCIKNTQPQITSHSFLL